MEKKCSILYVDDEEFALTTFNATFGKHFNIFTAQTQAEGFKILSNFPIHIIVSDQQMPEGTGSFFLAKVEQSYPDIVRMILTSHNDSHTIVSALNYGKIYQFLTKPWVKDEVVKIFENAMTYYSLQKTNRQLKESLNHAFNILEGSQKEITTDRIEEQTIKKVVYISHSSGDIYAQQLIRSKNIELHIANRFHDAIKLIHNHKIKWVISNMVMDQHLLDFFEMLTLVASDTRKVALTDKYINRDTLIEAINKGKLTYFLDAEDMQIELVQTVLGLIKEENEVHQEI